MFKLIFNIKTTTAVLSSPPALTIRKRDGSKNKKTNYPLDKVVIKCYYKLKGGKYGSSY